MLNKNGERELAYVVSIDAIEPIVGSDNCEAAIVGGWRVMVRKNTFIAGDLAIYFEIDSRVDTSRPEFAFLEKKGGKIKTQRYTFGGKGLMISQGLLMAPEDFGWTPIVDVYGNEVGMADNYNEKFYLLEDETHFLTKELGVIYAETEDNSRKGNGPDKYKKMAQRYPNVFKKPFVRWIMKYKWGRKIMFAFFGKKKDKRGWPSWVVKTDEERVQNMPWILSDKSPWIATEKIDGTSTTFTMKRGNKKFLGKSENEFYICSRNVVFDTPEKGCFYDTNVYCEMAEKYKVKEFLEDLLDRNPSLEWITLQGETYGASIQRRDYSLGKLGVHNFMGFNLIDSVNGRWNSCDAEKCTMAYDIPWVPIIDTNFILPDTVDELLNYATGTSVVDGLEREGIVFRSQDGTKSFKAVSNEFLLKYHG